MNTYTNIIVTALQATTARQGIFKALKFCGSPKIAENCNFCGINFRGIDTEIVGYTVLFILVIP